VTDDDDNPYRYSNTAAARMVREAIQRHQAEGTSLRKLAKQLRYKAAVVLSHFSNGRMPIPLERVGDIATVLQIDPAELMAAALTQRFPDFGWGDVEFTPRHLTPDVRRFVARLEAAAGKRIEQLTLSQISIMMEVAASPDADRRWLTIPELSAMEMLRGIDPDIRSQGLSDSVMDILIMLQN